MTETTPEQRAELRERAVSVMANLPEGDSTLRICRTILALLDERDALAEQLVAADDMSGAMVRACDQARARIAELEAREPAACKTCGGPGRVAPWGVREHYDAMTGDHRRTCTAEDACASCAAQLTPCPTCAPFGGNGAVWRTT